MVRTGKLSAAEMAERRQVMLQTAFRLFAEKSIAAVSMRDVAAETDYTLRSFQRYFHAKENLVIETAAWAFENFMTQYRARRPAGATAAGDYEFFLDSFLELYRSHADLLRFNQFFNIYVRAERIEGERLHAYDSVIVAVRGRFHDIYAKGDGTLRTDVPEEEMFSTTLHLMLAVVSRYAVGLVYRAGVEPERELLTQKEMLLRQYTVRRDERNRI